jgi:hypothetical protein
MKISSWAATALATPAIATGVCLWSATTAQAAPEDTSSTDSSSASSSESTSASSDRDSSDTADEQSDDSDDSDGDDTESGDDDAADADADSDAASDSDVSEDDDEVQPGPHFVPPSVRESNADALVTLDTAAVEEDPDSEEDSDGDGIPDSEEVPEEPADPEDPEDDTDTVELALEQIADARDQLNESTWESGNILAGLAAILPQMMLGGAQSNLERWLENHARLQEEFADTVNNPWAHAIARIRLENSMYRPIRAQDQMDVAEKLVPVVGWFGPRVAAAAIAELVHDARDNGLVYEIIEVEMQYNGDRSVQTEPVIYISVNGGERVPVLVDTGSLGLVINPRDVGVDGIGGPVGPQGESSYGDGTVTYYYHPYETTIEVGSDIETDDTRILIVDLESVQAFTDYNGDYVGVLGIGPNGTGPDTVNPFLALPGLLSQGVLFDERRRRLILGPNPYAARVTIEGAPSSKLKVKVGDYDAQVVDGLIDSGGILGQIPDFVVDGASSVPVGTVISVYTEDGETLLYSYKTTRANNPSVVNGDDDPRFNTGYIPFSTGTLYFSFSGNGTTSFNYA